MSRENQLRQNGAQIFTEPNIDDDPISCWICLSEKYDDMFARWVQPCKCRGGTRYVHHHCLLRWIDLKQEGDRSSIIKCSQCVTPYRIDEKFVSVMAIEFVAIERILSAIVVGAICFHMIAGNMSLSLMLIFQITAFKYSKYWKNCHPLFWLMIVPVVYIFYYFASMLDWEIIIFQKLCLTLRCIRDWITKCRPANDGDSVHSIHASFLLKSIAYDGSLLPSISIILSYSICGWIDNSIIKVSLCSILFIMLELFLEYYIADSCLSLNKRQILDYPHDDKYILAENAPVIYETDSIPNSNASRQNYEQNVMSVSNASSLLNVDSTLSQPTGAATGGLLSTPNVGLNSTVSDEINEVSDDDLEEYFDHSFSDTESDYSDYSTDSDSEDDSMDSEESYVES